MSPTPFQSNHHQTPVKKNSTTIVTASTNTTNNNNNGYMGMCPSALKIHRDSYAIKKCSSPTTSSGSVSSLVPKPQRGPVIIYTHSPKVIHTNPRDFMSLVQKLTGMRSGTHDGDMDPDIKKTSINGSHTINEDRKSVKIATPGTINNSISSPDDNETSSVITDENCSSSSTGDIVVGQLAPRFDPSYLGPIPGHLVPNLPFYMSKSSSDLLCCGGDPPLYNYMDFNFPYNQIN